MLNLVVAGIGALIDRFVSADKCVRRVGYCCSTWNNPSDQQIFAESIFPVKERR